MDAPNSKTALSQFLQRHIGRTLTRLDLTYTTTGAPDVFESYVTVNCLDGEVFRGVLSATEKAAEHSAASFALEAHAVDIASLQPKTTPSRKRGGAARNKGVKPLVMGDNPKTGLVRFLQKFLARTLTGPDTEYTVVEAGGQFQATLTIHCLQAEHYVGEPSVDAKQAEQSAAQKALERHSAEVYALTAQVGGTPFKPPAASKKLLGQAKRQRAVAQPLTFSPGLAVAQPLTFTPGLAVARLNKMNSVGRKRGGKGQAPGGTFTLPAASGGNAKGQAAGNHKTKLIQFLQAHVGRTLTKADVVYESGAQHGQHSATVTLQCLGGRQFFSGAEADEKAAHQAAAALALEAFPSEVAIWESAPPKAKKPRKSATATGFS